MRKSIATVSLSGTLEEKLSAAAQVGFDGVELFESDLISCALSPAHIRERVRDLGLRIELYQPFRDFEAVADDVLARNLHRADSKFQVMVELGVDTMLVCSNVSPAAVDDDDLAVRQLRQLAERAATYGVRIAYEALAWGRHVNDYAHAWRIIAAADHPNLGICLDSFHILSKRSDPGGIADIPAEKLFYVQIADAPEMHLDVLQWSRHFRCFPGQGSFDLESFLALVITAGYRGPLSLEVFNDVLRQADTERTATDALRSLIALEESLHRRLDRDRAPVTVIEVREARRGRPIELATPAPPAALTGYSFVEVAVDSLAEAAATHLLRCMGFTKVARHRSKPVDMWQQGEARVLLNRCRPARDDRPRGDALVSAIAVETSDPVRSATRAQEFLAPAIPRPHRPGEADLFATEAPDRTSVFFCRTDPADPSGWLADFEPSPVAGESNGDLVVAVDHVALSQPAVSGDAAALFYQAVLGLLRGDSEEVADPYGLIRSRAVSSAGGRVRLVLTGPALTGARRPDTADFQHVAFSCTNVFEAAERMRERGMPTLRIPDNYYRDLASRGVLADSLVAAMRELSILYDGDERGGEYFHFYTTMLGRRLFFGLVQRVNGYDGYASATMPVRMAAQYRQVVLGGRPAPPSGVSSSM